jgi:hypothetical protein
VDGGEDDAALWKGGVGRPGVRTEPQAAESPEAVLDAAGVEAGFDGLESPEAAGTEEEDPERESVR